MKKHISDHPNSLSQSIYLFVMTNFESLTRLLKNSVLYRTWIKAPTWFQFGIMSTFLLGLYTLRRPHSVIHPQFWAEDGSMWFADAYNRGLIEAIISPYAGYYQTLSRIIGGMTTSFTLNQSAAIMTWFAVAITLYTAVFVNRKRFYSVFGSRLGAGILSILIICQPNVGEVFANLTNSQWYLSILALFIIVSKPALSRGEKVFDWTIIFMSALTGPYVIFILPLTVYLAVIRRRSDLKVPILILGISLLIQLTAILSGSRFGQTDYLTRYVFDVIYIKQVIWTGILGQEASAFMFTEHTEIFVMGLFCIFSLYVIIKAKPEIKILYVFGFLIYVAAIRSLHSEDMPGLWGLFMQPMFAQRYFILPLISFYIGLIWCAYGAKYTEIRIAAVLILLVVCTHAIPRDFILPKLDRIDLTETQKKFDELKSGESLVVPINPYIVEMKLTKP